MTGVATQRSAEFLWVLILDRSIAGQYRVDKPGMIVVTAPDGRELARGMSDNVTPVLDEALKRYGRSFFWCESLQEAKQKAQGTDKPIVVLIESETKARTIEGKGLKDLHPKFVFAHILLKKDSEEVKELGASGKGDLIVCSDGKTLGSDKKANTEKDIKAFLARFAEKKE